MNFDDSMHTWNTQTSHFNPTDPRQLSAQIHERIRSGNRSERRVAFWATLIAGTAFIWIAFWVTQLATEGVVALQEKDFLPPMGIALITPAWVGALATLISANYFIQKYHRSGFADTLIGSVARAKAQTQHRVFLWRAVPLALASCVAVAAISVAASPQFTYALGASPVASLAVFIPDLAILTYIFIRGRRVIREKLLPQLTEIENLLSSLNTASPEPTT